MASSPSKAVYPYFFLFGVNLVLYTLFINVTLVECLPILACVYHVFGIVCCKIMSPREILFAFTYKCNRDVCNSHYQCL